LVSPREALSSLSQRISPIIVSSLPVLISHTLCVLAVVAICLFVCFRARSVVITRIFGLMINGTKTDGLVPMADMLNHKRPRETSWQYSDAKGAFTITALQSLSQGAQIYDSYGRKVRDAFNSRLQLRRHSRR
jgi:hypothetical protein